MLEIIAKGEVAQHFKECAVTGGNADALNVGRADALLAGGDALAGRCDLARKVLLHGCHAGVDEQQAVVVLGNERKARESQMSLALEEGEIFFSEFVKSCPFHFFLSSFLSYKKILLFRQYKKLRLPCLPKGKNRDERSRGTTLIARRSEETCEPLFVN